MRRPRLKALCLSFVLIWLGSAAAPSLPAAASSLNIAIDPRLELLAVVQYLSGYGDRRGLIVAFDFPYKKEMADTFAPFKDHDAVKLFSEMSEAGFSFDAPPAAMLYLSNPPELKPLLPFSDYLIKRAGGEDKLGSFVKALREFAAQAKFMDFFSSHSPYYQKIIADVEGKHKGIDYVGTLENYYGLKLHGYNVILVPLFSGGYGPRVERQDKTFDAYIIFGPGGVKGELPDFGSVEALERWAWHEFSHSFINPLTERFQQEVETYSSLYEPISGWMKPQAYGEWKTAVNEHIIRAVTARLAYKEEAAAGGREAAGRALQGEIQAEKSRGFFYIEALAKRLEQYEAKREKFRTLADFYPELIAVFKELSEAKLGEDFFFIPFTGTINGVTMDRTSVILVVPTQESDQAAQEKIHAYVAKIKESFFKGSPILTDKEALERDFSKNSVIAYGTVKGNLWIARVAGELPIKIEPDKIVAETTYTGNRLRFITAWPNPQNPKKGVLIYAAQQAEDIIGINSVFHGPTDYVIAKGTDILKSGDYKKQNGNWRLK